MRFSEGSIQLDRLERRRSRPYCDLAGRKVCKTGNYIAIGQAGIGERKAGIGGNSLVKKTDRFVVRPFLPPIPELASAQIKLVGRDVLCGFPRLSTRSEQLKS